MRAREFGGSIGASLDRPLLPAVVFGIIGASGSGKTQLGTELIHCLKKTFRDIPIAAIKHCPHGHEADREGSDTSRLKNAGASTVIARSPGQISSFSMIEDDADLYALIAELSRSHEVIVVEGYRSSSLPKILASGPALLPDSVNNVVATFGVSSGGDIDVPNFSKSEVAKLAEWIMANTVLRLNPPLVSLRVNGVTVDLKRFPSEALAGIVGGFVESLDGIPQNHGTIDLRITHNRPAPFRVQ